MDEQLALIGDIHLVEDQQLWLGPVLERFDDWCDLVPESALGIDDKCDDVGILSATPCRLHHRPVKPPLGIENAGCVDEHQLRRAVDRNAHQPHARCLCFRADDRHLLADKGIDQRRFSSIRRADDGDEATFLGHFGSFSSNAAAAAVSASCFELPVASASPADPSDTVTVKRGAWCGPERSVTLYAGGRRLCAAAHS